METEDDHVLEAVGLYLRPVLDFVRRDILDIARHVVRRKGIGTLCTNGSHQLVVLVGDKILGSNLRHRVNAMIGLTAHLRIGELAIGLVALFDVGQQGSLSGGIVGAKTRGALEHQVLQVVRRQGRSSNLCAQRYRSVCAVCPY